MKIFTKLLQRPSFFRLFVFSTLIAGFQFSAFAKTEKIEQQTKRLNAKPGLNSEPVSPFSGLASKFPLDDKVNLRKLASLEASEATLSPGVKALRLRIQKISEIAEKKNRTSVEAADELYNLIDEKARKSTFSTLEPGEQYLVARAYPLLSLRSFVWRMAALAENSGGIYNRGYQFVVEAAKSYALRFFPGADTQLFFDFINKPSLAKDKIVRSEFLNEQDLQIFFANELIPALRYSLELLEIFPLSDAAPIVIDNRLTFGASQAQDEELGRYFLIGATETLVLSAQTQFAIAKLLESCAYSFANFAARGKEVGALYGLGGIGKIANSIAVARQTTIKRTSFGALDQLDPAFGKDYMNTAHNYLKSGIDDLNQAWNLVQQRGNVGGFAVNSEYFKLNFDLNKARLQALTDAIKKPEVAVVSFIDGKSVKVKLQDYYLNPPQRIGTFDPEISEVGGRFHVVFPEVSIFNPISNQTVQRKNQKVPYKLYMGLNKYNVAAYRKIFPDVKNSNDVAEALRVMAEGRNSSIAGLLPIVGL